MKKVTLAQAKKGAIGKQNILTDDGRIDASQYVPDTPRRVVIRTARGVNSVARYERGKWMFSEDFALDVKVWWEEIW